MEASSSPLHSIGQSKWVKFKGVRMRLYSLKGGASKSLCEGFGYREEWKSGVISANYHGFDIQFPVNLPMHPL